MSSLTPQDLSPGQFRPSPFFVTAAFVIITAVASYLFAQQLIARQDEALALSTSATASTSAEEAEALPEQSLLGTLFVLGQPASREPAAAPAPRPVKVATVPQTPWVGANEAPPAPTAAPAIERIAVDAAAVAPAPQPEAAPAPAPVQPAA